MNGNPDRARAVDHQPRILRPVRSCMRMWHLAPGPACEDVATLDWTPADPLVVTLRLYGDSEHPWTVGRDLLADALTAHAGCGDVRMWPVSGPRGAGLRVILAGVEYRVLVELPHAEVRRFLARTVRQVPRGAEPQHIDLDRLVARLLAETP